MRTLFLILLFASSAQAIDCACLQEEYLSNECIDFSYTDEAIACEEPDPDEVRFQEIEKRLDKIESKLKKKTQSKKSITSPRM